MKFSEALTAMEAGKYCSLGGCSPYTTTLSRRPPDIDHLILEVRHEVVHYLRLQYDLA